MKMNWCLSQLQLQSCWFLCICVSVCRDGLCDCQVRQKNMWEWGSLGQCSHCARQGLLWDEDTKFRLELLELCLTVCYCVNTLGLLWYVQYPLLSLYELGVFCLWVGMMLLEMSVKVKICNLVQLIRPFLHTITFLSWRGNYNFTQVCVASRIWKSIWQASLCCLKGLSSSPIVMHYYRGGGRP